MSFALQQQAQSMSSIVIPSAEQIGAYSPQIAAAKVNHTMEPEAAIARALIEVATQAAADIDALQAGGGGGGPGGTNVWVVDSSVASSAYASGLRYVPLRDAQSDYIAFQLVSGKTGTLSITVYYAMSSASSANVRLRADRFILQDGGNPTAALTTGTAFTLAATNDVLDHSITSSNSADFAFSVTTGDRVVWRLNRLGSDGADTHTGDLRVSNIRVA